MNSVSFSWSWYYVNFANINKVKITGFNVLYWSLELLYSFGNLINDMNKKNSFSDSGYFLLRLPPMLCWRTRRLSTAWNRSTRLTSTKRPPSSASWGYWRRRMSPSLKRDPPGLWHPHPLTDQWPSNKCSVILILYPTREGSARSILCYMDIIFTLNDDLWCRTVLIIFY